jgi:hypothetical protein
MGLPGSTTTSEVGLNTQNESGVRTPDSDSELRTSERSVSEEQTPLGPMIFLCFTANFGP